MRRSLISISVISFLFAAVIGLFSAGAQAEEGVIRVGSISNKPKEEVEVFQPFVDYIASQLSSQGIIYNRRRFM